VERVENFEGWWWGGHFVEGFAMVFAGTKSKMWDRRRDGRT